MRFIFNEERAAQAAAYVIGRRSGPVNYMWLIKLLYLADRRCLLETGLPITGDWLVCMRHGTVLSGILELVDMGKRPGPTPSSVWFKYVSEAEHYEVSLAAASPDDSLLSRFQIRVLDELIDEHKDRDQWQLAELTHKLPEYRDPGDSMIPIQPEGILRYEGKTAAEIDLAQPRALESSVLRRIRLGALSSDLPPQYLQALVKSQLVDSS
jgi:hypothetical protein